MKYKTTKLSSRVKCNNIILDSGASTTMFQSMEEVKAGTCIRDKSGSGALHRAAGN